jgi:hypothetical protein
MDEEGQRRKEGPRERNETRAGEDLKQERERREPRRTGHGLE